MVHVLEGVPGFGSSLGAALGGGFGKGLSQGMEYAQKMALEAHKQKSKKDLYSSLFGASQENKPAGTAFQPLAPEQKAMLALKDPQAFRAYEVLEKNEEKKQEGIKTKENLSSTLGEMVNTLLEGNLGYTGKRFGKKGRRDVQYFDSLNTQLESIGKDMVSKNILSAPRFAFLLGNLPSSKNTDATNAGALEAWAKELDLDIPGIEKLKSLYEDKNKKNTKNGKTKLTPAIMDSFLEQTNDDVREAKKLAADAGYTW
jgi:hypothetical protein